MIEYMSWCSKVEFSGEVNAFYIILYFTWVICELELIMQVHVQYLNSEELLPFVCFLQTLSVPGRVAENAQSFASFLQISELTERTLMNISKVHVAWILSTDPHLNGACWMLYFKHFSQTRSTNHECIEYYRQQLVYLHNSNCILGVELFFPLAPSECAHTSRLCRSRVVVLVLVGYWLSFWFAPRCSLFVDVVYCGAVVLLTASRGRRRRLPFIWVCHFFLLLLLYRCFWCHWCWLICGLLVAFLFVLLVFIAAIFLSRVLAADCDCTRAKNPTHAHMQMQQRHWTKPGPQSKKQINICKKDTAKKSKSGDIERGRSAKKAKSK